MHTVRRWLVTLSIGGISFMLFAIAVGVAGAQRPEGGPGSGTGPGIGPGTGAGPGIGTGLRERRGELHEPRGELRDQYVARLAANLGLPEEHVRQALAQTREEMRPLLREHLEQARERLRERAQDPRFWERLRELHRRVEERLRGLPGPRPFDPAGMPGTPSAPGAPGVRPGGPGQGGPMGPDLLRLSAEILSLEPGALRQELEQGRTLAQIAQERGVSPSALADQLVERVEQQRMQGLRQGIERFLDQPVWP